MSLAIYRNGLSGKAIAIVLLVACLALLFPTAIVFAQAVISQKTIQMSGVNNSDLMIGKVGELNMPLLIDRGALPAHFNPQSPTFQIVSIFPLLLIAMALYFILLMISKGEINVVVIVTVAVLIFMVIALLTGLQTQVTGLLGG